MRIIPLLFLLACGGGTTATPDMTKPDQPEPGSTAPAAKPMADEAAVEAALLHEIAAGNVAADETICIRVRGNADTAVVLAAVQKRYPRAVDGSTCSGGGFDPVLSPDGGKAAMFDVGPVVRDDLGVRINGGGAHRGGGSATEIEYTLEPDGSGYRVKSEKVLLTN